MESWLMSAAYYIVWKMSFHPLTPTHTRDAVATGTEPINYGHRSENASYIIVMGHRKN